MCKINKPASLKIATWNANNVSKTQLALIDFISEEGLDAMLLSETWLKPQDHFSIGNFSCHRSDRTTGRNVGVVLLIRTPLHCGYERNHMRHRQPGAWHNYDGYHKDLPRGGLYHPLETTSPIILAGDLNAKSPRSNFRTTTTRRRNLMAYRDRYGYAVIGPTEQIHYGGGREDILHIFVV